MRIFARRTFLRFRYCSIHVKMHVLLTYSAVKRRVSMGSRNLVPAVSPMSGSPTFDTEKKRKQKIERGKFITPPRPTGRRSNYIQRIIKVGVTLSLALYLDQCRRKIWKSSIIWSDFTNFKTSSVFVSLEIYSVRVVWKYENICIAMFLHLEKSMGYNNHKYL